MFMSLLWRIPCPAQLEFIRGCRRSTRATSATSKSVCVTRTPAVLSADALNFSRASTNGAASISRTTKKCGTVVQLCVVRSAIKRATELNGLSSDAAGSSFELDSAKARMSDARISPSAPVPRARAISTLCSRARRLAFGEIFALPDCGSEGVGAERPGCVRAAATALTESREESSFGRASPGEIIQAIVLPTAITSPATAFTPAKMPSAAASISTTALSVSTSSSTSPLATGSPSLFRQATSLPVS